MNRVLLLLFLSHFILLINAGCLGTGPDCPYNYKNPDVDWPKITCAGANMCDHKKFFEQSPIRILSAVIDTNLPPLNLQGYADATVPVTNDGDTIVATYPSSYNASFLGGFKLLQLHYHTPAENIVTTDGQADMEVHFVHQNAAGVYAVLALMFRLPRAAPPPSPVAPATVEHKKRAPGDGANPYLDSVINVMASLVPYGNATMVTVPGIQNMWNARVAAKKDGYYHFEGSLTTPPCTEGIRWFVLHDYETLSQIQLTAMQSVLKYNSRITQRDLYDVPVYLHTIPPPNKPADTGPNSGVIGGIVAAVIIVIIIIAIIIVVMRRRMTYSVV